ncbi:bacteriohemerythrin [Sulfurisoma sediminicola]|uniref:Hemerythrin-like metal-binding protein n=1 Tax=Sulfurisoma sediminicola TaxID=1381557 RepID=A0A497XIB8_9PROT|nr:bacteriohemerythrin [Sulfurisoma sediminicola]RLJ67584.1 hemerythrin-like metal-binding protein [Sulfurisoma sediminicola]
MHIIQWTRDFALGNDDIDKQHQALVGMINALDSSTHAEYSPENMRRLLDELNDYVREHFGLEERLMAGGGCAPEFVKRHLGEHAYFRGVLRDLTADFEKGRGRITVPLIEYLVHWFLHHIAVVDRAMVNQLNAVEPELAGRVAAAALTQEVIEDLTESERHLLTELRRANDELERLVEERTRALTQENRALEAQLGELRGRVRVLEAQQATSILPGGMCA